MWNLNFSPIKSTKTYEAVAEQLKEQILSGKLAPGSRLPSVRELSLHWSVSQPVVREALSGLRAIGLIHMRQGEGTFVNQYQPEELNDAVRQEWTLMPLEDVRHLLELRLIMEVGAARLAAMHRTEEDVHRLQAIICAMRDEAASPTAGSQSDSDWTFHFAIAEASQNPFLASLMDSVRDRIQSALRSSRHALFQMDGESVRLLAQHERIVDAIVHQDEEAAAKAMLQHLTHVAKALRLDNEPYNEINNEMEDGR